jgi:formate hydrogenlyase subunit 6/NADH:ubiquinone oxidoreductase subunit I
MEMQKKPRRFPGRMLESVLRSLLRKPATIGYPFEGFTMPPRFRGKPNFHADECSGCKLCVRDCPAQAITIRKVGERKFEALLDLGKCIYCAQCADTCPKKAVEITPEFDLAQGDKGTLKVEFHVKSMPAACPDPEPPKS